MAKAIVPPDYPGDLPLSDYVRYPELYEEKIYALRVTKDGYITPIPGLDPTYKTEEAAKKACDMHNSYLEKKFKWRKGTADAIIAQSFKNASKQDKQPA